ncbi:10611_t:CDS:2, partial [Racocetra persica]
SDQAVNKLASAKKSLSETVNLTMSGAFGYSGQITIGGQNFTTIFDTGSSDLWVPWVNCTETACKKHRRFNERLSKSFNHTYNGTMYYMGYGLMFFNVITAQDNLQVGDIESVGQIFGLSTYENFLFEDLQFDGVFGMAFDDISTFGAATPFSNMINQKAINEPYFSFYLQRSKDDVGKLTLGGVDTTKFTGNLSYHKVAQYNGSYKFWMTEMDDISINGKKLNYTNKKAIFDTGVPAILMPYYDADSFHKYVNGSYNQFTNYVSQVSFIFGGISYNINASELILQYDKDYHQCISGVQSADISEDDTWVVDGRELDTEKGLDFEDDNIDLVFQKTDCSIRNGVVTHFQREERINLVLADVFLIVFDNIKKKIDKNFLALHKEIEKGNILDEAWSK